MYEKRSRYGVLYGNYWKLVFRAWSGSLLPKIARILTVTQKTQINDHEETFKTEVQTLNKPSINNQGSEPIQESENSIELLSGLDF